MALKKNGLTKIIRNVPKTADKIAEQGARRVKEIRDPLTPVDTAALLDSGEVVAGPNQGHWIFREGDGLPDARARYTEYGTDSAPAQPHVTPAAEQVRKELPRIAAAQMKALVGK